MTVNESQAELYIPVRSGLGQDDSGALDPEILDGHWRRTTRAWEEWAKSPFVTNAKIQDATIQSAKIGSLSADKITGGNITAEITVSGKLYAPSQTGWRVEIGDALMPIRYWDSSTTRFSLDDSGNVSITGAINATSGTVTGTLLVTGLIQAPSTTGFRVEIGNATTPFRYWDGTTSMLSLDNAGNVIARDIQINQTATEALGVKGLNTSSNTVAVRVRDSSDRDYFRLYNDGKVRLNMPTVGTAGRATLFAANSNAAIHTEGQFIALDGVGTMIGAGAAISDADFISAPQNGTLALTRNAGTVKLWARTGGVWESVVLT